MNSGPIGCKGDEVSGADVVIGPGVLQLFSEFLYRGLACCPAAEPAILILIEP
ncbi:MAG: hypothetical protein ACR2JE_01935 [Acidobacteriaceae bacterium]